MYKCNLEDAPHGQAQSGIIKGMLIIIMTRAGCVAQACSQSQQNDLQPAAKSLHGIVDKFDPDCGGHHVHVIQQLLQQFLAVEERFQSIEESRSGGSQVSWQTECPLALHLVVSLRLLRWNPSLEMVIRHLVGTSRKTRCSHVHVTHSSKVFACLCLCLPVVLVLHAHKLQYLARAAL